ncbi:hypothetical protein G5B46_17790 [Caulobacter sp. 602-2]|uniref:SGNH hydrolase-type esterase domain-containing protein n=1 Tax=Caulobacter sp. 602-2 TaxID=2710887 RepID=A0A6G4R0M2_9CAUL|nr:hypothetical protein [Caulobacter sp. 602-2]NGM51466.1 hypothetical protein [Caulobacter sp. 602-2]
MRAILVAVLGLVSLGAGAARAQTVTLDWTVADRFRVFRAAAPPTTLSADPGLSAADAFLEGLRGTRDKADGPFPESASYERIVAFLGRKVEDGGPMNGLQPFEATRWQGAGPGRRADGLTLQRPAAERGYEPGYLYPKAYAARVWVVGGSGADTCDWTLAGTGSTLSLPCDRAVLAPVAAAPDHQGGVARVTVAMTRNGAAAGGGEASIQIRDRLVIGLGDSYASGEGNPDQPQAFPADFQTSIHDYWTASSDPYDRWWRVGAVLRTIRPARWWDPICHRSLYSQQAAAAFIYAAEHPKEAVTFASFACSGAEVLDGVIASQQNPPGVADFGAPETKPSFKLKAQIDQVLELICDGPLHKDAETAVIEVSGLAAALKLEPDQRAAYARTATRKAARCAKADFQLRKPDIVLMSIGGNDIGFAGAVKNALLPTQASDPIGQLVLARVRSGIGVTPTYVAHRKIMFDLPRVYPVMRGLMAGVAPEGTIVIQTPYPNPLYRDGAERRFCHGLLDNQLFTSMNGMFPDHKIKPENRWRIGIDETEGREVYESLFTPLNLAVATNASNGGWRAVQYGEAFTGRGWCAGDDAERRTFAFPAMAMETEGKAVGTWGWAPFNPGEWDPYKPRTRLFRTSNDVVLTQIGSSEPFAKLMVNLGNRSFFASSGIFHPTAQAHVIIGLKVAREMESALAEPAPRRPGLAP